MGSKLIERLLADIEMLEILLEPCAPTITKAISS
jgi:hypothetical protein